MPSSLREKTTPTFDQLKGNSEKTPARCAENRMEVSVEQQFVFLGSQKGLLTE